MTAAKRTRSGIYKVGTEEGGSGSWAFVASKLVALSVVCGALVTISGAVAAGVKFAHRLDRPNTEAIVRDVIAPLRKSDEAEHERMLPKTDFEAWKWRKDAQDSARDDDIREMRENFKYIRERLDKLADERGARERRGG